MDLLFQKYASPFSFLDELISNGDFFDWVLEFIEVENDRKIMEVWLHKIFDQGFDEFKNSIIRKEDTVSTEQIETTIVDSKSILNTFIPEGVKHGTI